MKLKSIAFALDFCAVSFGFLAFWLGCTVLEQWTLRSLVFSLVTLFGFGTLSYWCGHAATIVRERIKRKAHERRMVQRIRMQHRGEGV